MTFNRDSQKGDNTMRKEIAGDQLGYDTEAGRLHEATRMRAVEYVAKGKHGYEQIYTTPSCQVYETDDMLNVQVWVAMPKSEA